MFHRLQEETARVEEHLLSSGFSDAVVECFTNSKANAFENFLEPLQKLLRISPIVAQSLGRPDLFSRILQKLNHNKAVIRLNLLRIVRSICESRDEQGGLLRKYGLLDAIQRLADSDSAVLVRNMASELVKSALERDNQPFNSVGRRRMLRRASSSTSAAYPGSSPFQPTTPLGGTPSTAVDRSAASSALFDVVHERRPPISLSAFRPTSRDGGSGSGKIPGISNVGKSRLPRTTSTNRIPRLSFGGGGGGGGGPSSSSSSSSSSSEKPENKTPVTPSFAHHLVSQRRRPATSTTTSTTILGGGDSR